MAGWAWIPITLFAVVMQTLRTAGQKHLTDELDPLAVTLVRFLFGLPFAAACLGAALAVFPGDLPVPGPEFYGLCLFSSLTQILATVLLVHLFSLRNFAVGTTYARTEAFLTALVGAAAFGEAITVGGWTGIVVSAAGVVVLTLARVDATTGPPGRPALVGLGSGLAFALCSLTIRKASLSLEGAEVAVAAGITLVVMVAMQTVLSGALVLARTPGALAVMARRWRPCVMVGLTSALGSAGWFTAFTLERASYVKALGQAEFLLALGVSTWFFGELTRRLELAGMALVGAGIFALVLAG